MSSLYLKYRPQTFDEVIGQKHITKFLQAEVATGNISHAYIFIGPRGTGKTSTARILAKAVNCPHIDKNGNPCNKCNVCKAINTGKFLDIIEIDAASNRGIDEIRALKERIEFKPVEGNFKVYIIDEVHMLTKEAFNALLKTLEEPPKHVIFILATTEPHKIPATILSRCEKYEFRLGNKQELTEALLKVLKQEGFTAEDEAINLLVEHSGGSYRDLLSIVDTIMSKSADDKITYAEVRYALGLPDETMVFYYLQTLITNDTENLFAMLNEVFIKGINIGQFIKSVIKRLEIIIIERYKGNSLEGYHFLNEISLKQLTFILETLIEAYNSLKYAIDYKLPLELATFKILNYIHSGYSQVKGTNQSNKLNQRSFSYVNNDDTESDLGNKNNSDNKSSKKAVVLKAKTPANNNKKSVGKTIQSQKGSIKNEDKFANKYNENKDDKVKESTASKSKMQISANLNLDQIKENWYQFIKGLKPYNGHLYAFLLEAVPKNLYLDKDLNVYKLEIGVRFNFHKQRIELPASQQVIAKVAEEVFGTPIQFISLVLDSKELLALKENIKKSPMTNSTKKSNNDTNYKEVFEGNKTANGDSGGRIRPKQAKDDKNLDDFDAIFGEDVFEE